MTITLTNPSQYDSIEAYRRYVYIGQEREKLLRNMERALQQAKYYFDDEDEEKYIVIAVEGYPSIAYIIDEFLPIEIAWAVFPYDASQIYPIQSIKQEIRFMTYRECIEASEIPPM